MTTRTTQLRDPKYRIGQRVHFANGLPGTGIIIRIELIALQYLYTADWPDGRRREAWEQDVILIDAR